MSDQIPVVEAFRVMAANKSLSDSELHDLIRDGIHAALARRFGGPVEAEIETARARFPRYPSYTAIYDVRDDAGNTLAAELTVEVPLDVDRRQLSVESVI